jgi:hypothetical protein
MNLYKKIIQIYPDLIEKDFFPDSGTILLQNNSDGKGDYIAKWEHELPRPTDEQLASIQ